MRMVSKSNVRVVGDLHSCELHVSPQLTPASYMYLSRFNGAAALSDRSTAI
jgi:hypothetical protein